MNRQEFLRQLESLLMHIPANERADAMAYYNDYFDEAGAENEQRVIQELGSPQKVAQSILSDIPNTEYEDGYQNRQYQDVEKKKFKTWQIVLLIVLAVIGSPIWIGLAAGLLGVLIGVLGCLFGLLVGLAGAAFGLVIGGIGVVITGILGIIVSPLEAVTSMGVGLLLTAIGLLLVVLFILVAFVCLPKLGKAIVRWVKGLFHRNEGGNEI